MLYIEIKWKTISGGIFAVYQCGIGWSFKVEVEVKIGEFLGGIRL